MGLVTHERYRLPCLLSCAPTPGVSPARTAESGDLCASPYASDSRAIDDWCTFEWWFANEKFPQVPPSSVQRSEWNAGNSDVGLAGAGHSVASDSIPWDWVRLVVLLGISGLAVAVAARRMDSCLDVPIKKDEETAVSAYALKKEGGAYPKMHKGGDNLIKNPMQQLKLDAQDNLIKNPMQQLKKDNVVKNPMQQLKKDKVVKNPMQQKQLQTRIRRSMRRSSAGGDNLIRNPMQQLHEAEGPD